jgi:hypothetical protein
MIPIKQTKVVVALPPQFKNNGAFINNTYWDRAGWGHERILFIVGITDVIIGSDGTSTPPFIEECDTSDGSYTPVDDAELAAVIGAGDDNKIFAIDNVLTRSHSRYGRVNAPTAGSATGANLTIVVILSKPSLPIRDAADQGFASLVEV